MSKPHRIALRVAAVTAVVSTQLFVSPFSVGAKVPAYRGARVPVGDGKGPFSVESHRVPSSSGNTPGPIAMVGASWVGASDAVAEVRVRNESNWSGWLDLDPGDHAEDGQSTGRSSTEPRWVKQVEEVEVRVDRPVNDVQIHVVREDGQITLPSGPSAHAVGAFPPIISRETWGARPPKDPPQYASTVKMAFVHHTATSNDYSPGDAYSIMRAIQSFHMDTNGWNDIGYQFLVDRHGQTFEGRGGGIDKAVIGAQAQGFNEGSTAVAAIGHFQADIPPNPMMESIANVLAWKLPLHGADPASDTVMVSAGGELTKYPAGTPVALATISAHRDTGRTVCPGDRLYGSLDWFRLMATLRGAALVPYPFGFFGGTYVAAGNLDNSGLDELVTGAGESGASHVRTYAANGSPRASFFAYPDGFYGGVRVAVARTEATGPRKIVTGAGPSGGAHVRMFTESGSPLESMFVYPDGFYGGVFVAGGNVDGVPGDEIVTGPGESGGPHVRVLRANGQEITHVFAYPDGFYGGVRVAAGDLDGDSQAEIVTAAGPSGGPHIRVWKMIGGSLQPISSFFAYPDGFYGGVYVAVARLADGSGAIVTGAGESGGTHLRIFRMDGTPIGGFFVAHKAPVFTGIRVAAGRFENSSTDVLAIGGGQGSYPLARLQRTNGSFLPIGP
jgi:hypothetical protein